MNEREATCDSCESALGVEGSERAREDYKFIVVRDDAEGNPIPAEPSALT